MYHHLHQRLLLLLHISLFLPNPDSRIWVTLIELQIIANIFQLLLLLLSSLPLTTMHQPFPSLSLQCNRQPASQTDGRTDILIPRSAKRSANANSLRGRTEMSQRVQMPHQRNLNGETGRTDALPSFNTSFYEERRLRI